MCVCLAPLNKASQKPSWWKWFFNIRSLGWWDNSSLSFSHPVRSSEVSAREARTIPTPDPWDGGRSVYSVFSAQRSSGVHWSAETRHLLICLRSRDAVATELHGSGQNGILLRRSRDGTQSRGNGKPGQVLTPQRSAATRHTGRDGRPHRLPLLLLSYVFFVFATINCTCLLPTLHIALLCHPVFSFLMAFPPFIFPLMPCLPVLSFTLSVYDTDCACSITPRLSSDYLHFLLSWFQHSF